MRIRPGAYAGNDVYFVRTDASDESFASSEELVYVPKLASRCHRAHQLNHHDRTT